MPRSESNDYERHAGLDRLTPEEEDRLLKRIEDRIDADEEAKGPSYYAVLRATVAAMNKLTPGYDPTTPRVRSEDE